MASYNKTTLLGRVMGDPDEPRVIGTGSSVVKFRLAVGRSKKDPQTGQWVNDKNQLFIDCEAWAYPDAKRNLVNVVSQYVKKGGEVLVEGTLKTEEWEDKNGGGKRSKILLVVNEIQLLGGKGDGGGEQQQTRAVTPAGNDAPPDGIPW